MHLDAMTTSVAKVVAQVESLSAAEKNELWLWLAEHEAAPLRLPKTRSALWPDIMARLNGNKGGENKEDAPAAAENTVIALREMERF